MKKAFILALFLFACSEGADKSKTTQCFSMVISDAIPVQFWVNGCQTYNEKVNPGINKVCFCQPFECDDQIKIQIIESHSVAASFSVDVIDNAGNIIVNLPFTRGVFSPNDVYSLTFVPIDHGICDKQIVLNLLLDRVPTLDVNGDVGDPNGLDWNYALDQVASSNKAWTLSSTDGTIILGGSDPVRSKDLISHFGLSGIGPTSKVRIKATVAQILGSDPVNINGSFKIFISFYPSSGSPYTYTYLNDTADSSGLGDYDFTLDINHGLSSYIDISFAIERQNTVDAIIGIFTIFSAQEKDTVAYSDCIDIRAYHAETILINYFNHRNFAGIENQDVSPDIDFNLRIPAVFFEEEFPQEQEIAELSDNQEISLNSQVKVQRLLNTGLMPQYMHKKTILALMHQSVYIDGEYWVKADPYEKIQGNKRNPLKQYKCLLTQKDEIIRNIL